MPQTPPNRHRVRVRRLVAGSFLAAVSAASAAGLAAVPAEAETGPSEVAVSSPASPDTESRTSPAAGAFPLRPEVSAASVSMEGFVPVPALRAPVSPTPSERLRGVRAELDGAVALRLVTAEQANSFFTKIERRVASGL
jgi:hypothetical protein